MSPPTRLASSFPSRTLVQRGAVLAVAILALVGMVRAQEPHVPTPEAHLRFRPGADGHLASWNQVVEYFRAVGRGSKRVAIEDLGSSTEGRPMVAAVVSSPETIAELDTYKQYQAKLHDPRRLAEGEEAKGVVEKSKPVVVISCSIHSTETASTLMALELLHELATRDDPGTREILGRTIVVIVPSANPDGVDKVERWYERTKGKPWEGSGMIELYHKYAGHDTNRDWFMLNLVETRNLSRKIYRDWYPTVLHDVHQMGSKGARLFVPPFHDPINPNLDPRIHQSIFLIGAHMAADLAVAGKRGILTGALYDNWWNGGNRTTPQRHNIVAVLTEAASVRMATPIFLDADDLEGRGRGFPDHKPSVNFVDPWPGGWWRLRDIVEYELIATRALLTLTARYRDQFQSNLLAMAREAIAKGTSEPPFAWIVSDAPGNGGATARMLQALEGTGIEIRRARDSFRSAGVEFAAGTWIIPAAQPYRAHVKDMLERQQYPTRLAAGGKAEPPYDVAGWTLPLQMGARVVEAPEKLEVATEPASPIAVPAGSMEVEPDVDLAMLDDQTADEMTVLAALLEAEVEVRVVDPTPLRSSRSHRASLAFPLDDTSRGVLREVLKKVPARVVELPLGWRDPRQSQLVTRRRIAVYQPWSPSMDEGWTRLVLERFKIPHVTIHNAEIRAGRLRERHDVILVPSIGAKTLANGQAPNETEPAYVGGLGSEGADALREFVAEGGRVVCLDASCEYAIETFQPPGEGTP